MLTNKALRLRRALFVNMTFRVPSLATTTRAPTRHAAVAASASGHDGSAGGAAWAIAHVVQVLHGVRCVVDSAVFER